MNLVHSLTRRQEGFESLRDYDIALYRLKCYNNDIYRGIAPNIDAPDFNPEPPVFACRFCTTQGYEEILALANEDGKIAFQNTTVKGEANQPLEGTQAHCNAIFDVAWMPAELKLVTVSGDHTARLWDIATSDVKQIQCFHAHTRSVKTAVFRHEDKAVFATGARDGSIMLWDTRASHNNQPRPDNCISNAHNIGSTNNFRNRRALNHISRSQSITGLAFQDDFTLISCAAGDGLIKVWDVRKNYTVHKKDPLAKHIMKYGGNSNRNGFSSLLICPARITLYASCMDNVIYAYNVSSYNPQPIAEFYGHQNCTYYVKTCLSPDGRYLASGSSDEVAYIWNTKKPGCPIVKLCGHTEEVTCIAWCGIGQTKIVTCSDDSFHRIWRIGNEFKGDNDEIEVRGQAQAVANQIFGDNLKLETTPTTSRIAVHRMQDRTPGSDATPDISERRPTSTTPGLSSEEIDQTKGRSGSSSSLKRSFTQMMAEGSWVDAKFKAILSPIQENLKLIAKRSHMDYRSARRLFGPNDDGTFSNNRGYKSDEPSTSSCATNRTVSTPFSPTLNLPNFVIDGTAPHLLQASPEKFKENIDWLTKIRRERYEQIMSKTFAERSVSPKAQVTPLRRNSRSRSTEPQKISRTARNPALSLLDFFKVSSKDDDGHLCSKSGNNIPHPSTS